MRRWSIVIAIAAAVVLVLFIAAGNEGRSFDSRASANPSVRPRLPLNGVGPTTSPSQGIVVVLDEPLLPEDAVAALNEARELIADAVNQLPEQAKDLLEQAIDRIDDAQKSIDKAIDDTSNLAVKQRLERINSALAAIKAKIQDKVDQL
jgi:hypothetical protein